MGRLVDPAGGRDDGIVVRIVGSWFLAKGFWGRWKLTQDRSRAYRFPNFVAAQELMEKPEISGRGGLLARDLGPNHPWRLERADPFESLVAEVCGWLGSTGGVVVHEGRVVPAVAPGCPELADWYMRACEQLAQAEGSPCGVEKSL